MKFAIENLKAGWFLASITHKDKRAAFEASNIFGDDFPKRLLTFLEEILRRAEGTSYITLDDERNICVIKIDKTTAPALYTVKVYSGAENYKNIPFEDESRFHAVKTFPALTQHEFSEFVGTVIEEFKFYIPEAGKADYVFEWVQSCCVKNTLSFPYNELIKLMDTNRRVLNAAL